MIKITREKKCLSRMRDDLTKAWHLTAELNSDKNKINRPLKLEAAK
jgi:hypothetical protein